MSFFICVSVGLSKCWWFFWFLCFGLGYSCGWWCWFWWRFSWCVLCFWLELSVCVCRVCCNGWLVGLLLFIWFCGCRFVCVWFVLDCIRNWLLLCIWCWYGLSWYSCCVWLLFVVGGWVWCFRGLVVVGWRLCCGVYF